MKVRAVIGFAGQVSMYAGQSRDIPSGEVLQDLLDSGYVEPVQEVKSLNQEVALAQIEPPKEPDEEAEVKESNETKRDKPKRNSQSDKT